jgi:hypothetical protein
MIWIYFPMEIHMKLKLILCLLVLCSYQTISAQDKPAIRDTDRIRVAEAFRLNTVVDDRIWKGWAKTPFAILLVTPEYEVLIRHPKPSPDFTLLGYDSLLKSNVYFRKRKFPTRLLATAPFIQGSSLPVIVVGQAENTEVKTSTAWVVTLFHEHFHQLQYTQPTYQAGVEALNLTGGDKSGGWMLNYAFPYDKQQVQEQFAALSKLLVEAVNATGREERATKLAAYLAARQHFEQTLSQDDYKYISFQFWQEGIARYTEYRVAELAASKYKPSKEYRALKDFTPFAQVANETRERIIKQLLTEQLGESKREVVYPFGAAEGLLLDSINPSWHGRYVVDKFDLNKYYRHPQIATTTLKTGGEK